MRGRADRSNTRESGTELPSVADAPAASRRRRRVSRAEWVAGIGLSFLAFLGLFPFVFMLLASLKDNSQFYSSYWAPAWPLHFGNYAIAGRQVWPYFVTTIIVAAASVIGTLALATTAGFVFGHFRFLGRNFLFGLMAMLLMVPSIASLIPLFVEMRNFGLLNTRLVLILPQIAGGVVFGTVLIRTFTQNIPEELFASARVDGAGGIRLFWNVMLPLSLPAIGTVTLIVFMNVWNEFFWPLLTVTKNDLRTVPVGLSFFQGQNATSWGPLFAGYTISSLPLLVVFVLLSKYFLAGVQGGSAIAGK